MGQEDARSASAQLAASRRASVLKTVLKIIIIADTPKTTAYPILWKESKSMPELSSVQHESTGPGPQRALIILALLVSIGLPLTALSQTLTVYSGRGERFTKPIIEAFEQQTGIVVRVQVGASGALLAKLQVEGDRSPADVFITNYVGVLEEARQHGLLAPVTVPSLVEIAPEFRSPDGTWVAFSARLRVIVYNTDLIQPGAITSLMHLADPEWQGKVGTVTSGNQSFIGGLSAIYALQGEAATEAFLRGLKANSEGRVLPKHTPVVSAVAAGQFPLGYVNHYYYYRHKAKEPDAPLDILIPDQRDGQMGAVVTVAGAGVLKAANNPTEAQEFMAFLISPAGQEIFAAVNYEYPVVASVPAHEAVVPRSEIRIAPVNLSMAHASRDRAIALIDKVGLD